MATAAIIGGSVIGAGGSILAAREQRKAQKAQTAALEGIEARKLGLSREQFEFARQQIAEGKPLRDALQAAGLKTIPQLTETAIQALTGIQQDLTREPGTGALFQTGLKRGFESLTQQFGQVGIDRSAFRKAGALFTEGLVARDIQSIRDLRTKATGFAPGAPESTLGVGSAFNASATNIEGQAGQIGVQRAGVLGQTPYAGLFSDLSSVGSSIATTAALGKFGKTPGGGGSAVPKFNLSTGQGF